MVSPERLADIFVEVANTLVDDFDLVDFLHGLTDHAVDLSGGTSAGLLLADHDGNLHFMAASSDAAKHLELFQIQHDEGPCMDCYATRQPVTIVDLSEVEGRWPNFATKAIADGVRSVHAFPMRFRDQMVGALNVFGSEPLPLEPADINIVQAMADIATIAILQERAIASADLLTEQLQGALNSRIVIEQAKGVVSRQLGVSVDEAFRALRTHARNNHLRLVDVCEDVVNGAIDLPRS